MDELDDLFKPEESKKSVNRKSKNYDDDLYDDDEEDIVSNSKSSSIRKPAGKVDSLEADWANFGLGGSVKSYSSDKRSMTSSKYTLKSRMSYVTKQELQEELLEHKDEYQDLANLFEHWLNEGIVTTDTRLRCPLLLAAEWRKKMKDESKKMKKRSKEKQGVVEENDEDEESEDEEVLACDKIPYCKGNSNGFPDLNSLYLHASTKGARCPFHFVLANYLMEQYPDKISHGVPTGNGARFRPVGPDHKDRNLKDLLQEGLSKRPPDVNMKIVWPPTVCISKLPIGLDSKNKIMDAFSRFHPNRAAPYYDVHGFSGDCILVFSADPEGFFYAQRLLTYLNDKARKDFDRQTSGFFATPKQMQMAERLLATKKLVTGWRVSTYAHEVYHPARKLLQEIILSMKNTVVVDDADDEDGENASVSNYSTIRSSEISGWK